LRKDQRLRLSRNGQRVEQRPEVAVHRLELQRHSAGTQPAIQRRRSIGGFSGGIPDSRVIAGPDKRIATLRLR
jgi:hypothetical protein